MSLSTLESDLKLLADPETAGRRHGPDPATPADDPKTCGTTTVPAWGRSRATRSKPSSRPSSRPRSRQRIRPRSSTAVEAVRSTLGTEVVSALDVTVGFSENDGDS